MNNNVYPLLAIDGGGTKTIAVITDQKGTILGRGKAGASNYQAVGRENAKQSLISAINHALQSIRQFYNQTEKMYFECAVFALAGIDTKKDHVIVNEIVNEVIHSLPIQIKSIIIENDGLSTLLGATKNSPGLLLISGTGSIAFYHDGHGNYVRAGGWGHRVGDEGSGYWIGKEAIRAVLKMYDGREKTSILSNLIINHFQFSNIEDLYNWVYSDRYSVDDVSSLTLIVEKAANQGDEVSRRILDSAVFELEQLLLAVLKRGVHNKGNLSLILQGGVLHNNFYIRQKLLERLKNKYPNINIMDIQKQPIYFIIQRGLEKY